MPRLARQRGKFPDDDNQAPFGPRVVKEHEGEGAALRSPSCRVLCQHGDPSAMRDYAVGGVERCVETGNSVLPVTAASLTQRVWFVTAQLSKRLHAV